MIHLRLDRLNIQLIVNAGAPRCGRKSRAALLIFSMGGISPVNGGFDGSSLAALIARSDSSVDIRGFIPDSELST